MILEYAKAVKNGKKTAFLKIYIYIKIGIQCQNILGSWFVFRGMLL